MKKQLKPDLFKIDRDVTRQDRSQQQWTLAETLTEVKILTKVKTEKQTK